MARARRRVVLSYVVTIPRRRLLAVARPHVAHDPHVPHVRPGGGAEDRRRRVGPRSRGPPAAAWVLAACLARFAGHPRERHARANAPRSRAGGHRLVGGPDRAPAG